MRISSHRPMDRRFWLLAACLLGFLATVQILSVREESATYDEPTELAAGYSYLKTGDYRLNTEHPPLAKLIAALPLLALNPSLPLDSPAWTTRDEVPFGRLFLFHNRVGEDQMLFAARLMSILLTACLGLAIALWTRSNFGPAVAILALTFFAFDPTITAHGRYVKSDVPFTLFAFLACIAWAAFLNRPTLRYLLLSGLTVGLAAATKFSAVFLAPVFVILFLIRWRQRASGLSLLHGVRSILAVGAMSAAIVLLCYAPEIKLIAPISLRTHHLDRSHPYFEGVMNTLHHNNAGHPAYLLGMHSTTGWWYYFPVAFAVKTPVATLIAIALAFGLLLRAQFPLTLAVPLAIYVAASLTSSINIGIRHLLPAYPFLFILTAAVLVKTRWRGKTPVLACLAIALAVESMAIYPYYLAFFNAASGGPSNGPAILVDSNIDWGQEARRLKSWMITNHVQEVCLAYLGADEIPHKNLPMTWENEKRESLDCFAAISATFLHDVYQPSGAYAWLRARQPIARIGYSIYIYDLRKLKASTSTAASSLPTHRSPELLLENPRHPLARSFPP